MKYTIWGFQQTKLIENGLDNDDALILRVLKDMYSSTRMEYVIRYNDKYMWIKYDYLLKEIPIIGSRSTLKRKVTELVNMGILKKIVLTNKKGKVGSYLYVAPTKLLDNLEEYEKINLNSGVKMNSDSGVKMTQQRSCHDIPFHDISYQSYRSDQGEVNQEINLTEKTISKKRISRSDDQEIKDKTENKDNQSINQSDHDQEIYNKNKELIAKNIDYEILKQNSNIKIVEDILNLMTEVASSNKNYIQVGREQKLVSLVKSTLLELNSNHIKYVLDHLDPKRFSKVKNKKSYMLTTLYNAYSVNFSADQQKNDENSYESSQNHGDKESYDKYKQIISQNIEYETIKVDDSMVENIYELMVDTVSSQNDYIRVGKENKPASIVKSVFLKLNGSHVQYVMDCIKGNTSKINNIKAYITTALYNAYSTIDVYYTSQVQHDLYSKNEDEIEKPVQEKRPAQATNYEQRDYDDAHYESFYDNFQKN